MDKFRYDLCPSIFHSYNLDCRPRVRSFSHLAMVIIFLGIFLYSKMLVCLCFVLFDDSFRIDRKLLG